MNGTLGPVHLNDCWCDRDIYSSPHVKFYGYLRNMDCSVIVDTCYYGSVRNTDCCVIADICDYGSVGNTDCSVVSDICDYGSVRKPIESVT